MREDVSAYFWLGDNSRYIGCLEAQRTLNLTLSYENVFNILCDFLAVSAVSYINVIYHWRPKSC